MAEQPTGTVTMLFTDIEGSTRLLQALGRERYSEALDLHRRLLREALQRHHGYEVDCEGDSFFVAFPRAEDAVAAAAEAQHSHAAATWPDGSEFRVRMGVHTGEPLAVPPKYVGLDVHRAARIMAAGHGGQVLVSDATRQLLSDELIDRLTLRDLGEHRLKDLTAPQRIWQLGDEDFAPLKSLHRTSLPVAATPLIGRTRELAELAQLLRDSVRLVTVTGPGGTGKTRLALQAAADASEDFEDGVFFVALAPLRDHELVIPTIGQAVGAKGDVQEHLRHARALLVLDNVEHLLDAAPGVGGLLAAAPKLRILATSRAPLHLASEHEYMLDPLADDEAVAFFLARARAAGRLLESDQAVAMICRRLDNLPLALELAAGRLKLLDPETLLHRLGRALPLLTGGVRDAPERQQTLRATIEWSYELLDGRGRDLLARLSVFAGSFGVVSAEAVCNADLDGLQSLVDLNLLKRMSNDRLLMLETIREFATERLADCGEPEEFRRLHAEHYYARTEALRAIHSAALQNSFELDQNNFRVALDYLITEGPSDRAFEMADRLTNYWVVGGQLDEGEHWLERALAAADANPSLARARAMSSLGEFARFRGDDVRAVPLKEAALQVSRTVGDVSLEAATLHDLADTYAHLGDRKRAHDLANEALAVRQRVGEPTGIAHALSSLFDIELFEGRLGEARLIGEQVLEIEREHAPESVDHSIALYALAECQRRQGDLAAATHGLREALRIARSLNQRLNVPDMLFSSAAIIAESDPRLAGVIVGAAEGIRRRSGFYLWDTGECERIANDLRDQLGESSFEQAGDEGASLDGDTAMLEVIDALAAT